VLITLKKFIPTILPTLTVVKLAVPNGIEPRRVFTLIELVKISFPMPTSEVSGHSSVVDLWMMVFLPMITLN
jgi:hypothetical protein